MALIKCQNCGKEISDASTRCRYCDYPTMLKKPKFTVGGFLIYAVCILFVVGSIILLPNLIAIIMLCVSALALFAMVSLDMNSYRRYKLATKDFEAYKHYLEQQEHRYQEQCEEQQEREKAERASREKEMAKLPPCPVCGSKNYVKRISMLNRSASIAVVGLASSKIGKQYECTHCKHKW